MAEVAAVVLVLPKLKVVMVVLLREAKQTSQGLQVDWYFYFWRLRRFSRRGCR